MDRFSSQQIFDRSHAPAVGAPADGLAQGMVYTAVIQSVIVEGMVAVTVPALHLSQTFQAHIKPDANCAGGETCLVELDEFKTPWVITGSWVAALGTKWTAMALTEAWANLGGGNQVAEVGLDVAGKVSIRGTVKSVTPYGFPATNTVIGVLPEGRRPQSFEFAGIAWQKDSEGHFAALPVSVGPLGTITLTFGNSDYIGTANNGNASYLTLPPFTFTTN